MDLLTAIEILFLIITGYKLFFWVLRYPRISDPDSCYILITGCDSGFGNATAKRLDSLGCHVIAACLTEKGQTELQQVCSEKLCTIQLDISAEKSVHKAYEQITKILPSGKGLWGLLNNATIGSPFAPICWLKTQDFQQMNNVNLYGPIRMTMKFLPLLKKEKGRIVNTSSVAGRITTNMAVPYSVSKSGLEAFPDGLRRYLRQFDMSVSIIEPSGVKTPLQNMFAQRIQEKFDSLPEDTKQEYGQECVDKALHRFDHLRDLVPSDTTPVVDAYEHALLATYPVPRYVVGRGAFLFVWLSTAPEWLSDFAMNLIFPNLPPKAH